MGDRRGAGEGMATGRKVLVVQNTPGGGPGRVGGWLREAGLGLDVVRAYAGEPLPVSLGSRALVVLGGGFLPDEDGRAPWLPAVRRLTGQALEGGNPVLGICLGGQLLAHVAGGRVRAGSVSRSAGVRRSGCVPRHAGILFSAGCPRWCPLSSVMWTPSPNCRRGRCGWRTVSGAGIRGSVWGSAPGVCSSIRKRWRLMSAAGTGTGCGPGASTRTGSMTVRWPTNRSRPPPGPRSPAVSRESSPAADPGTAGVSAGGPARP